MTLYVLHPDIGNGKVPIHCSDTLTWGRWFEEFNQDRIVRKHEHFKDNILLYKTSTVFVSIDHEFRNPYHDEAINPIDLPHPPLLFETMVFDQQNITIVLNRRCAEECYQLRYSTWESAELGHVETVALVNTMIATGVVPEGFYFG